MQIAAERAKLRRIAVSITALERAGDITDARADELRAALAARELRLDYREHEALYGGRTRTESSVGAPQAVRPRPML